MPKNRYFSNTEWAESVDIAKGVVLDATVRNIFGYQTAGDSTLRAVWEFANTSYIFPTTAQVMTVTTANAGDGGKLLKIVGLDSNYNEIAEVVTLAAAGDVNTTTEFFRINDVILISGITNVGLITVQNTGKTIKYGGIRAGDGRNQCSVYTVPQGFSYYLYRIDAFSADSSSGKPAIFRNFTRLKTGQEYNTARTTFLGNMNVQRRMPFRYQQCSDIQLQMAVPQGSHELGVFSEGILVKN